MTDLTDDRTKRAVKCAGTVSCKAPSTPEKGDSCDTDRKDMSYYHRSCVFFVFRKKEKMDMTLVLAAT